MRTAGRGAPVALVTALAAVTATIAASAAEAAFPGQNGRIAFLGISGGSSDVYSMNPDGSGVANLTAPRQALRGVVTGSIDPAYSADGNRIAFTRFSSQYDVFAMNADGSGQVNLTSVAGGEGFDPAYSPDGSKIAFTRSDGGDPDIFVMNADGTDPVNLTPDDAGNDSGPVFSPDGSKIAFTSFREGNQEIFVMNANGSAPVNLTPGTGVTNFAPDFSPDGSRIAYTADPGNVYDIFSMSAVDGSGKTNLTQTPELDELNPAFSPDGTMIAFEGEVPSDQDIFVMSASGANRVNLTVGLPTRNGHPSWGPVPRDTDPPETVIDKQPKKKTEKDKAKLKFSADEPGVTFECRLKGKGVKNKVKRFDECEGTEKYKKLETGKKKFFVQATDAAGNTDPTPAKAKWKVLKD